jgi:ribosomal protein L21E
LPTAFSRDFKKKGMIQLSTYLKQYKVGDVVDVVANGAVQQGMVRSDMCTAGASCHIVWLPLSY